MHACYSFCSFNLSKFAMTFSTKLSHVAGGYTLDSTCYVTVCLTLWCHKIEPREIILVLDNRCMLGNPGLNDPKQTALAIDDLLGKVCRTFTSAKHPPPILYSVFAHLPSSDLSLFIPLENLCGILSFLFPLYSFPAIPSFHSESITVYIWITT